MQVHLYCVSVHFIKMGFPVIVNGIWISSRGISRRGILCRGMGDFQNHIGGCPVANSDQEDHNRKVAF